LGGGGGENGYFLEQLNKKYAPKKNFEKQLSSFMLTTPSLTVLEFHWSIVKEAIKILIKRRQELLKTYKKCAKGNGKV